jgi:hypothetical protein
MRLLLLLFLSTASLAQKFVRVERKDWVADWSDWVMRSTVTSTGKVLRFLSPGPRAHREVLLREVYQEQLAAGMRKTAAVVRAVKRASLLTAEPLKLRPLEVLELSVDDAAVRGLELEGDAALVFWTLPQEGGSTLYIQGRKSGHSSLRVTTASGIRLLPIDVP